MKKLILSIGLALATTFAFGQNHTSQNLLGSGITSVLVTNTMQITNILYALSPGSNTVGTVYTNNGTRIVAAAGSTKNLLADKVALWTDRDGNFFTPPYTNAVLTDANLWTPASICVRSIAGSGANSAVTLGFFPVMNDALNNEVTGTAVTVAFTPTASATQVWRLNFPVHSFPGAKYVRLAYISNADGDASSGVTITHLSLNGFVP